MCLSIEGGRRGGGGGGGGGGVGGQLPEYYRYGGFGTQNTRQGELLGGPRETVKGGGCKKWGGSGFASMRGRMRHRGKQNFAGVGGGGVETRREMGGGGCSRGANKKVRPQRGGETGFGGGKGGGDPKL